MALLPAIAIVFKGSRWAIEAGLDGRTVYHVHNSGSQTPHSTPYWARLRTVIGGRDSFMNYACPLNVSPIDHEWTVWPR